MLSVPHPMEPVRQSAVEKALFQLLYAMTKGAAFSPVVGILHQVMEDVQLYAFAWSHLTLIPFVPHWIDYILNPFSFAMIDYEYFTVLFWLLFVVVMTTIGLMVWVGVQFQKGAFKWIWPLVLLRHLTTFLTTVLFEPVVYIFFVAIHCEKVSGGNTSIVSAFPDISCSAGKHLPMVALGCLAMLCIVPLAILINYVFVEGEPDSREPHTKAHGRCEVIYMLAKLVLVLVGCTTSINSQLVALFIIQPVLIYVYARYQPYANDYMTCLRVGIFTGVFLSTIVALATYNSTYKTPSNSPVPIVLLLLCIPTGVALGRVITHLSRRWILQRIMTNLKRRLEMEASDTERGSASGFNASAFGSLKRRKSLMSNHQVTGIVATVVVNEHGSTKGNSPTEEKSLDFTQRKSNALTAVEQYGKVSERKSVKPPVVFRSWVEADIACRFMRDSVRDETAREIMNAVFSAAIEQYPKHPGLLLTYAYYLWAFGNDPSEAAYYIEAAKANSPPFDVRFRIFMEEREHEQETRAEDLAASSFNVASFVEYQSLERQAIDSHMRSLMAMKAFWSSLSNDQLNADTISAYLHVMYTTQQSATSYYEKLLDRFPNYKQILRLYAKYLLTVKNNNERGAQLLKTADDIEFREEEETRARLRTATVPEPSEYPKENTLERIQPRGRMNSLPEEFRRIESLEMGACPPALRQQLRVKRVSVDGTPNTLLTPISDPDIMEMGTAGRTPSPPIEASHAPYASDEVKPHNPILEETDPEAGSIKLDRYARFSTTDIPRPPIPMESTHSIITSDTPKVKVHRAKSHTSSNNSTRDARKQKAIRNQLKINMVSAINKITLYGRLWFLILLGLVITNFRESASMFDAPKTFLSTLREETRPRRICVSQAIDIRRLWANGKANDAVAWNTTWNSLRKNVERSRDVALPIAFQEAAYAPQNAILVRYTKDEWGSPREVLSLNPYEMAKLVVSTGERILSLTYAEFADWRNLEQRVDIRLWLDNILQMCDSFNEFADTALDGYRVSSGKRTQTVVALLVVVVAVLVVSTLLFYFILRQAKQKQRAVLNTLKHVPRTHRRKIVDDLEEEIEELLEMEDSQGQAAVIRDMEKKLGQKLIRRYAWYFIGATLVLLGLAVALFIPPLISNNRSDEIASMILVSNSRRYQGQVINYLSHELPANDTNTWSPWRVQMEMEIRLRLLEMKHHDTLHGADGVPSLFSVPEVDHLTRMNGTCLRSTGCDGRKYNPTIGLTQQLVLSGADNLLRVYIDTAKRFLTTANYSYTSPDLLLIKNIEPDIADGLMIVDDVLLAVATADASRYVRIVNVLFSVTIIYWVCFYAFFFWKVIQNVQAQIRQMVGIVFWVPAEAVADCQQLQQFISTGGIAQAAEAEKKEK